MHFALERQPRRDDDGLLGAVLADAACAVARAQAGGLRAAHRQLERRVVDHRVVHGGGAGFDAPCDFLAALGVTREHRRGEAIGRVVGEPHGLLGVVHLHDRQGRPERLLGHDLHRVVDIYEHGRLVEATWALQLVAAREHARALLHSVGDVVLDRLQLGRERDRANLDRAVALRLAHSQGAHLLGDFVHELLVDRLLNIHALDRDGRLAGILHRVVRREVGRALQVGVGEHDHGVLAAELERGGDQPPGGRFGDLSPGS